MAKYRVMTVAAVWERTVWIVEAESTEAAKDAVYEGDGVVESEELTGDCVDGISLEITSVEEA